LKKDAEHGGWIQIQTHQGQGVEIGFLAENRLKGFVLSGELVKFAPQKYQRL
jgi:hypothetical protein